LATSPSGAPHPGDHRAVPVTVTVAAVRGGAFGVFSGGDQRRCNRRPVSVLDLSSSS